MDEDSVSWFPDLLYAIIGVVLGALASNTIVTSLEISSTVSVFTSVVCGLVLAGMHFVEHRVGRLLQIAAAVVLTVVLMAGK